MAILTPDGNGFFLCADLPKDGDIAIRPARRRIFRCRGANIAVKHIKVPFFQQVRKDVKKPASGRSGLHATAPDCQATVMKMSGSQNKAPEDIGAGAPNPQRQRSVEKDEKYYRIGIFILTSDHFFWMYFDFPPNGIRKCIFG